MSHNKIVIEIVDKVATCLTKKPLVCGNSKYKVEFVFDEEWNEHLVKTAVFNVNGTCIREVFEGNVCKFPVIQNAMVATVGVFAGTIDDGTLATSTSALVKCKPCATDGDGVPAPPPDDVYNQIAEMCGEAVETAKSVEQRANNGEFKGDAFTFDDLTPEQIDALTGEVASKAVDDAQAAAVKAEQSAKNASTAAKAEVYTAIVAASQVAANAIRDKKCGNGVLAITDGSFFPHNMAVTVRGKNFFNLKSLSPVYGASMMLSKDAVTIRTSVANYPGCTCQITDKYLFGKTVSFSCNYEVLEQWAGDETYKKCRPVVEFSVFDKNGTRLLYRATKGTETPTGSLILSFVLPSYENGMYLHCGFHISNSVNGSVQEEGREVVFSNVQLEVDSQATPYAPYIDNFSGVTIKRYGKNILPYPYRTMGTQKINGITFKVNDDRSVTVSGVATADANFALWNADLGAGMLYNGGTNGEYSVSPMIRYVPSTKNVTVYVPSGTNLSTSVTIYPQIEVGTVTTDYEPYKDPTIHISETDGLVKGVISYYPVTTLVPDAEGIAIDCEYNIDPKRYIDKKFSELQALILEV